MSDKYPNICVGGYNEKDKECKICILKKECQKASAPEGSLYIKKKKQC